MAWPTKQQRLFIARQACESCRLKKTRCDAGNPCGACRNAGIDCTFGERKATKNEVSLGMIFNALQRIEHKIEDQQDSGRNDIAPPSKRARRASTINSELLSPEINHHVQNEAYSHASSNDHNSASPAGTIESTNSVVLVPHKPIIQYPIRQIATWPAVRALLKNASNDPWVHGYSASRATLLDQSRAAMPPPIASTTVPVNWIAQLHISLVKDLCDNYFSTFNLTNPILDRQLFSQHTLSVAINSEFGFNIESSLVLMVMALGSLGKKALQEAGFTSLAGSTPGMHLQEEGRTADDSMVYFNEARKRVGFVNCDNSVQSCQFYLLSGLYYSALLRPSDWWTMVNRASLCCISFWSCPPEGCNEWLMDMQSRLYWITAMFEAVLTQELELPTSILQDYGDRVPLPKFVDFPGISSLLSSGTVTDDQQRDSFCHYHFLSQIAHRIILTRMYDSMFADRKIRGRSPKDVLVSTLGRSDYPPQALEDELLHQLEQWRQQLPETLQWDDTDLVPLPSTPENILVVPWLRARYLIFRYHLRRPLLHRALHHPDTMTDSDYDKVRDAFSSIMDWASLVRLTISMRSCLPLKFFICTQFFGQVLLFHAFKESAVSQLSSLVPDQFESWAQFALSFLEECAPASPIVAREFEIVTVLLKSKPLYNTS